MVNAVSRRTFRSRRTSALAVLAAAAAVLLFFEACTYDFYLFDPVLDADAANGGGDGTTGDDGDVPVPGRDASGADGGVTDAELDAFDAPPSCSMAPPPARLSDTVACKNACAQTANTCRGNCNILSPPSCVPNCDNNEIACRQTCFDACVSCTGDAGCEDPLACNAALN